MDMNVARAWMMLVLFGVFIGIVLWAWSGRRSEAFDAAARLPLDEDDGGGRAPHPRPGE